MATIINTKSNKHYIGDNDNDRYKHNEKNKSKITSKIRTRIAAKTIILSYSIPSNRDT